MFMDRHGMILNHAVPAGQTVNAAYYSKVVRRDLMHALRKKDQYWLQIRKILFTIRIMHRVILLNRQS